jgi:hypothetical protein
MTMTTQAVALAAKSLTGYDLSTGSAQPDLVLQAAVSNISVLRVSAEMGACDGPLPRWMHAAT